MSIFGCDSASRSSEAVSREQQQAAWRPTVRLESAPDPNWRLLSCSEDVGYEDYGGFVSYGYTCRWERPEGHGSVLYREESFDREGAPLEVDEWRGTRDSRRERWKLYFRNGVLRHRVHWPERDLLEIYDGGHRVASYRSPSGSIFVSKDGVDSLGWDLELVLGEPVKEIDRFHLEEAKRVVSSPSTGGPVSETEAIVHWLYSVEDDARDALEADLARVGCLEEDRALVAHSLPGSDSCTATIRWSAEGIVAFAERMAQVVRSRGGHFHGWEFLAECQGRRTWSDVEAEWRRRQPLGS